MINFEFLFVLILTICVIYTSIISVFSIIWRTQRAFVTFTLFFNLTKLFVTWAVFYAYVVLSVDEAQLVAAALTCLFIITIVDWRIYVHTPHSLKSDAFVFLAVLSFLTAYVASNYEIRFLPILDHKFLYLSISCGLLYIPMALGEYSQVKSLVNKRIIQVSYLCLAVLLITYPFLAQLIDEAWFVQAVPFYALPTSLLLQVWIIFNDIKSRNAYEKAERDKKDKRFDILNIKGFAVEAGDIRQICARLDQGVSIAAFEIKCERKSELEGGEYESFPPFMYETIQRIKFSLRKHDLFCYVDSNIFAILLPFTDIEKGKLACLRLREAVQEDLLTKGAAHGHVCGIVFGVSGVARAEINILPALQRAVEAMTMAMRSGTDIEVWSDTFR